MVHAVFTEQNGMLNKDQDCGPNMYCLLDNDLHRCGATRDTCKRLDWIARPSAMNRAIGSKLVDRVPLDDGNGSNKDDARTNTRLRGDHPEKFSLYNARGSKRNSMGGSRLQRRTKE